MGSLASPAHFPSSSSLLLPFSDITLNASFSSSIFFKKNNAQGPFGDILEFSIAILEVFPETFATFDARPWKRIPFSLHTPCTLHKIENSVSSLHESSPLDHLQKNGKDDQASEEESLQFFDSAITA